jgi:hypothetical protein
VAGIRYNFETNLNKPSVCYISLAGRSKTIAAMNIPGIEIGHFSRIPLPPTIYTCNRSSHRR